ncbi:MAG: nucleotidyltransferase substrate binding protein [Candidatus Calescibacterium sp.]|nr:nucleotidyltransferase substrate binding protein [Candidatus Calescibacterium sp.]
MKKTELLVLLSKLKRAYYKLKEAVNSDIKSELERDGVIQRFEFTFDIFWKTLKIILRYKGIECFVLGIALK